MQPRLIRLRDAPDYLGMDINRFYKEVKPYLVVIPIGKQGIAFDRLDLDAWVDHYKQCSGRPAERRTLWDAKERQDSTNVEESGKSTKSSMEKEYAKAAKQAISEKQRDT